MPEPPADITAAFADAEPAVWTPPPWPKDCPQPGVYPGIPDAKYRAWPAISNSALKMGWHTGSALHMKAVVDGTVQIDSRAKKFGRAVHGRLLEPATYAERFPVATPCVGILKGGDRKGQACGKTSCKQDDSEAWFCGTHAPKESSTPIDYVSPDTAAKIERMHEAVMRHEVSAMLHAHGGHEVSLVWERDGLACKGRLDKLITGETCPRTVVDLKKGQACELSEDDLRRSIRKYHWEIQAEWYASGVKAITGEKAHFAFVFMEDGEPFDVRPVWAGPAMRELGRIKIRHAFGMYKHCLETGEWPGYCSTIETLDPADWEIKHWGLNT